MSLSISCDSDEVVMSKILKLKVFLILVMVTSSIVVRVISLFIPYQKGLEEQGVQLSKW